jgi:uncharacterized protein YndB with AHSA1/START domain
MAGHIATASTEIAASTDRVWAALTDPEQIKLYMFGSTVETDWRPGSKILWKGEYDGKPYEDKGEIIEVEAGRLLKVTHFSPLSGQEDTPENYHALTYRLEAEGPKTRLSLSQDNNPTEEAAEHSRKNWETVLDGLKDVAERDEPQTPERG